MGKYFIGTSGFSYADWVGPFYPPDLGKDKFLPYYAERFPFVELNFTYYRQPTASAMEKMKAKGGSNFLFTVKAHGSMTHERDESWQHEVDTFLEGIRPLEEGRGLAGLLLQFPYSFHYTGENRKYLAALTERVQSRSDIPLLVEFRNKEWERESVEEELKERALCKVVSDTPGIDKLPDTRAVVTADTAYLRLHGRNADNWWKGDNTSRYDYLYSRVELQQLLPAIRALLEGSRRLFIAFNNHHKGQAVENALMLKNLIEEQSYDS